MFDIVIYHANCPDGFCAAWLFHTAYPDAVYVPAQYGDDPPDVSGKAVAIVDFSYKRFVMESIIKSAASTLVLDHHKTAEKELAGLDDLHENALIHFNMEKSGAHMAWDFLCSHDAVSGLFENDYSYNNLPLIVQYVEDRDFWKFDLPQSHEFSAGLQTMDWTFDEWDEIQLYDPHSIEEIKRDGNTVLRYQEQLIRRAVARARSVKIAGHDVMAVNVTECFSEIAGELAQNMPFGVAYFIRHSENGDVVQFSLRSRDEGADVSEIAKLFGGGGHRNAAGFELSVRDFLDILSCVE